MSNLISLTMPSLTNPGVTYTVYKSVRDGAWVCSCPAWRFSQAGAVKSCKHLVALATDLQLHALMAVTTAQAN